jgi:transposase
MERRQVTEAPEVTVTVTGHQLIERECPCCGARTKAQAPAGVTAPVQYGPRFRALAACLWHGQFLPGERACAALGEMPGCAPAPAVIAAAAKKIAGCVSLAIGAITKALPASEVVHFDETGFRVAGRLAWVHWPRRRGTCCIPCTASAAPRGWTPPVSCRPSPGSRCMAAFCLQTPVFG